MNNAIENKLVEQLHRIDTAIFIVIGCVLIAFGILLSFQVISLIAVPPEPGQATQVVQVAAATITNVNVTLAMAP